MGTRTQYRMFIAIAVAVGDVAILNMTYWLAFLIRFGGELPAYNWAAFYRLFPFEAISLLGVFYVYGLYHYSNKTSAEMKSAVVTAVLINGFIAMAITFLLVNIGLPRSVFLIAGFLQILLYGFWHLLHRSYMLRSAPPVHVLVVGPEEEWGQLVVRAGQFLPRIIVHTVTPTMALDPVVFAKIQAVIVGHVEKAQREQYFLSAITRNIPCLWVPDTYDVLVAGAELTSLDNAPMFSLASVRTQGGSAVLKRVADIVVSAVGLVGFSFMLLIIAVVTRLDSGGPILYRQERLTMGGRTFQLLKFRTMVPDAEIHSGPVLSHSRDPRITRVGRFLRASHLDEAPQLWNILKGEMSLVGPRPERPVFVEDFRKNVAHYDLRHFTVPGLTGLAQVSGTYASSPEDKATYDLYYVRHRSGLKDLFIVIQTIIQFFRR